MSTRARQPAPPWEDDWIPPNWSAPQGPQADGTRAASAAGDQLAERRQTAIGRPTDNPADLLRIAVSPAVSSVLAVILWVLSPLPGAGPSPAPLFFIALVQIGAILVTRDDRPPALSLPWLTQLAATVGLLPLLAIQVSLLREPYVALGEGSAWPAIIATVVALGFAVVSAGVTTVRFWKHPDQASLVFLPSALLVPAAIGQRSEISIGRALSILALAMALGAIATLVAALLPLGPRLLVAPVTLGAEMVLLWAIGQGPVFHSTSGGIVRILYVTLLFGAIGLLILVPVLAVWLRRASASLPPPPARGVPI